MSESTPNFTPFNQVGFTGVSTPNGIIVNRTNAGYKSIGGYIDGNDSNNTGLTANFGYVVSSNPASALNTDGNAFVIGEPGGYLPRGILVYDAAISQNDPAKSGYFGSWQPVTVIYEGTVRYSSWGKTQTGAIDPIIGCLPIFRATSAGIGAAAIGAVEFLPAQTAIPTGWQALPAYVVEVTSKSGVALELNFNTEGVTSLASTPFLAKGTLTSAAAATPVIFLADVAVPSGKKIYVSSVQLNVSGGTAWTDATATKVTLEDTNGTPVVVADFAKAGLTGNAYLNLFSANVTPSAAQKTGTGLTTGKGLQILGDANFAAGSDIIVQVTGFYA